MFVRRTLPAFLCLLVTIVLTGCSTGPLNSGTTPIGNSRFNGSVHGGQQPVTGASIQLYTVGTTGDGSAATPLLTSTVTSDATGSFTITGLYSCSSATQVYIVATGGNPGLSATNPNIALMAALGPCSSLTPSTFITINELTTAAAVSALAPYMSSLSAIGSSASDATSLANAFTLANELVNTATGTSPGANLPTGFSVPTTELNTLADILSACINSAGGTAGDGSLCGSLFSLTTVTPNPAPTNTIAAMLNITNNPTINSGALYALTPPTPPFQSTLTSPPANFAVVTTSPTGGLQATPLSISFPDTTVGFTSLAQTITVENTGTSYLQPYGFYIGGTNASDFSYVDSCELDALNPGGICSVHVKAAPSATGTRTASLSVDGVSIPLTVKGVAPSAAPVTLAPANLTYVLSGTMQDLTLTNTGSTLLHISSIQETDYNQNGTSGSFSITASTCGTSLAAQSSCTISVQSTYTGGDVHGTPLIAGGSILVMDDASGGPQTASLSSQNHGYFAPSSVTFSPTEPGYSQTNQSYYYTGYNAYGEYMWPSVGFSLGGANPGDFSAQMIQNGSVTSSCASTPAYQGNTNGSAVTCQMAYTFTPTTTGPRSAKAFLTYNAGPGYGPSGTPGQQPYVLLQATGAAPGPSFTVDQGSLAFTSELPSNIDPHSGAASTITLQNNGSTTVKIGASLSGIGAPYISADLTNCSSPVAPHGTCLINVSFTGPSVGNYPATLTLSDTNSTFTLPVSIGANTVNWSLASNPASLSFSNQALGTESAAQTFTIADPNGYPLGHPYSVTLQQSSNFVLTQGSTCPASTTQTCTLAIAFSPQTSGYISENAIITDQTSGVQTTLVVSGMGGGPLYTLSSSSLTFPSTNTGALSGPFTVTLTNAGTQPITVSGLTIAGAVNNNFTETSNCGTVPVYGTCSINITFAPTATGTQSATLQINSNAVSSPTSISLTGTATP